MRPSSVATAVALAIGCLAGCSYIEPSDAAPTSPSSATTVAATVPPATTAAVDPDATVPNAPSASLGCVDDPGTLRAPASAWYHSGAAGVLALTGEFVTSKDLVHFAKKADDFVQEHTDSFVAESASELAETVDSCPNYRSVQFDRDDGTSIIVAAWRVEGAVDPAGVPNDAPFVVRDDATLVSDGAHIRVVLVVAPDGTTVRVSAYGKGAVQVVSGWPSTTASTAPIVQGDPPASIDDIVAIGRAMLSETLRR
jgi:hypothetical protein